MTTVDLIREYLRLVRDCVSRMRKHFGVEDLLSAWRQGRIPKSGVIADSELSYSFHGIGCTVEVADLSVDFDFGPDGDIGGFDAYRLTLFANSHPSSGGQAVSEDEIRVDLMQLQEQGVVIAPRTEPSPHLLYFRPDGDESDVE